MTDGAGTSPDPTESPSSGPSRAVALPVPVMPVSPVHPANANTNTKANPATSCRTVAVAGRRQVVAWLAGAAGLAPSSLRAQPLLRLVVAYPPGGVTDAVARALAPVLGARLGEAVVVENRAGAGGALALHALARSAPDGRTLVLAALPPAVMSLDADGPPRLAPVAGVMATPALLVGTSAFRGHSFEDMLAAARARPHALRWATSGVTTTGHLILAEVSRTFGIAITHVPYKGGGQQLDDAIGGEFELLSTNVGPLQVRCVRSGRWRPLAVGAPSRVPVLPAVPTLAELGCPRANLGSTFALFAAPGTAAPRVDSLNAAVDAALRTGPLADAVRSAGSAPLGGTTAALADAMDRVRQSVARLAG